MAFLQGNTYLKPVQVLDCEGKEIAISRVVKGEFVFGDVYKYYGDDGDVVWSESEKCFIVPLTEGDTFSFKDLVECQARLVLDDGSVSGSIPESHYVYESKSKTRLTEGGSGEESGKLLTLRLMKEFSGGGVSDYNELPNKPQINGVELVGNKTSEELGLANKSEIPVVPTKVSAFENDAGYIKEVPSEYVTETELNDAVKDKATINYVDTKVADLVNSAPETLDTLGEVAKAIQDNDSVVDALNNAIGSKADKSEIPTKTSDLDNDSGFITKDDIPATDLTNYYTKDEVDSIVGDINTALVSILGV